MLRKQQSRDNCDADENNHGDSALDPGSGDWRKRPGLLSRRHWRVEHSDAGNFSRRKTSARRRCLSFRFVFAVSEFVRHYPPCYSHSQNPVQRGKFVHGVKPSAGPSRVRLCKRIISQSAIGDCRAAAGALKCAAMNSRAKSTTPA